MGEFEVRGRSVEILDVTRPLTFLDYPHKPYYWLVPPDGNPPQKAPGSSSGSKRKEEKLHEILSAAVEVKRRKTSNYHKNTFEVNPCTFPTFRILTEIYKSQKKTLEDMKESLFGSYRHDKSQDSLFDLSVLYPYMSNAYKQLYGQHLENLKEITRNFKQLNPKPTERKTIRIQGIVAEDSLDN